MRRADARKTGAPDAKRAGMPRFPLASRLSLSSWDELMVPRPQSKRSSAGLKSTFLACKVYFYPQPYPHTQGARREWGGHWTFAEGAPARYAHAMRPPRGFVSNTNGFGCLFLVAAVLFVGFWAPENPGALGTVGALSGAAVLAVLGRSFLR